MRSLQARFRALAGAPDDGRGRHLPLAICLLPSQCQPCTKNTCAAAVLLLQDAGVSIAWAPSQKCDDSPGGNCALCNEYALQCLVCLGGYGFNGKGECQLVRS